MLYKEDWEQAKKRWIAWWDGEILDRCCACVTTNRTDRIYDTKIEQLPEKEEDRIRFRTDPEWVIKKYRNQMERHYYIGEAFPRPFMDFGAAGHAGFFKNAKWYLEDTVWFFPTLESLEELEFDENSFLYKKTLEVAKALAEDSKGDYIIPMSDCTGNADALSHLVGPENLMLMMLEEPEVVQAAMKKVQQAYERIHRETYEILKDVNQGGSSVGWLRTWAPGFHAQMQSDMSVMISPDMFKTFIEPELRIQSDFLEYPLYHFDGIEQIRHLDSLLSIEKLRVIQWTQVVGQPPVTDYIPELQRIQKAGKNLLIIANADQIAPLMENLSSKGLMLMLDAPTEAEGEAMLKEVSRLTHE